MGQLSRHVRPVVFQTLYPDPSTLDPDPQPLIGCSTPQSTPQSTPERTVQSTLEPVLTVRTIPG
jgi:hypothetical protein